MASIFQEAKLTGLAAYLPSLSTQSAERYRQIYEDNRHRVYALAFWMMDSELAAEELTGDVFRRVFARTPQPDPETIDKALLAELREHMPIGSLTLNCGVATETAGVRRNTMRIHLERAVVQLPPTERLVFLMHDVERYDLLRISRTLGLTEEESRAALHQSRLKMRELLAEMPDRS
jgi:RNA polymerase sigma-70 factor, ECF subfamily